jgi:hypothetical protein
VRENNVVPVVGNYLEVHGLPTGDGVITAGYIERKTTLPTPPFAVKGQVRSHDTVARTFTVGTLTVNYSGAGRPTSATCPQAAGPTCWWT